MQYRDLRDFIANLEADGELSRVTAPVDPNLEMTVVCDRTLRAGGPAILFENPTGFDMPVFEKRRFQRGAVDATGFDSIFPESPAEYRRVFAEMYQS